MSDRPPGAPPPYYPNNPYPVPPAMPPGYSYYPGSVMVYPPLPNPQPETSNNTYITNVVYQQPEQVQVVDNVTSIDWIPATASSIDKFNGRAVVAGYEGWDNSPLWVIRARLHGGCIPGKFAAHHKSAYVPYSRKEVRVYDFEILVGSSHLYRWVPSSNGAVPPGAIRAGHTISGEPLYVGRARYLKSLTPGKIHPSHGCCYISFAGKEVSFKLYEVLCSA